METNIILIKIERLRQMMYTKAKNEGTIRDQAVIKASQMLDEALNEYYRLNSIKIAQG